MNIYLIFLWLITLTLFFITCIINYNNIKNYKDGKKIEINDRLIRNCSYEVPLIDKCFNYSTDQPTEYYGYIERDTKLNYGLGKILQHDICKDYLCEKDGYYEILENSTYYTQLNDLSVTQDGTDKGMVIDITVDTSEIITSIIMKNEGTKYDLNVELAIEHKDDVTKPKCKFKLLYLPSRVCINEDYKNCRNDIKNSNDCSNMPPMGKLSDGTLLYPQIVFTDTITDLEDCQIDNIS